MNKGEKGDTRQAGGKHGKNGSDTFKQQTNINFFPSLRIEDLDTDTWLAS